MLRPTAVDDVGFTVEPRPEEPASFVVRGAKPERWVQQTDFDNDEAVGYLADRLDRLGVEKALAEPVRAGRLRSRIGPVGFEWHPAQLEDFVSTSRGTDDRLDRTPGRAPTSGGSPRTCAAPSGSASTWTWTACRRTRPPPGS